MSDTRTFGDLVNRIDRELARDGLTADIRDAIADAKNFYRDTRFWFNEEEATAQVSTGTITVALPSDFVVMDEMILEDSEGDRFGEGSTFRRVHWQDIFNRETADDTAQPTMWAIHSNQIHLRPVSDGNYTLRASYLRDIPLSASSTTTLSNAWTTDAEELIRHKAKSLVFSNKLRNREEAVIEEQRAEAVKMNLVSRSTRQITTNKVRKTRF